MITTKVKVLLLMFSIIFVSIALSVPNLGAQGSAAVYVDPPTIADLSITPGKTFSINITASGVENLWGYVVVLSYNKTILTATAYHAYDPFTQPGGPSIINDTGGWVYTTFTMPLGAQGVSGRVPLLKLDFSVDALGVSPLNVHDTKLANAKALSLTHSEVDGFFTNIQVHNIEATSITASPTRVAAAGGLVSLSVNVSNVGDFDETFHVSVTYDSVFIGEETNLFLGIGEKTTRTFSWDTTGLAQGEYTVSAKAIIALDNSPSDNTQSAKVRIGVTRDVAVTNVTASQPEASVGESIITRVTVKNLGNFTEAVTVHAKYDSTLIGTTTNQIVEPHSQTTLTINWRTGNVSAGDYVLSAEAVIPIDDNPANNVLEGDRVRLGGTSSMPVIFLYVGGALVAIVVVLIILRLVSRARKPKPEEQTS